MAEDPVDPAGGPAVAPDEAPSEMYAKVAKVIEIIRPAIQADKGDIVLREVDEESGVVTVELQGACVTCPASTETMKAGVERILMDRVEGVNAVNQLNADLFAEVTQGDVISPFTVGETSVSL